MKEILTDEKKRRIDKEFLDELRQQIEDLKNGDRYADAREVLKLALKEFRDNLWVNTELALCYYLDETLPMEDRVAWALERLVAADPAQYMWTLRWFKTRPEGVPSPYPGRRGSKGEGET